MSARTVFVISPIGSPGTTEHRRYEQTLKYIVKKAFSAPEWRVVRADEETSPDSITTQVIGRIIESDLIVADLTDHNPNVFYELAVAHGYKKPVIHLMQRGQKVPFDVVDQRVIFYDLADPESVDRAQEGLIASARWLDDNPSLARNPLSAYEQFATIASTGSDEGGGGAVAEAIEQLSRQIARLDAAMRRPSRDHDALPLFSQPGTMSDLELRFETLIRARRRLERERDVSEDVDHHLEQIGLEMEEIAEHLASFHDASA